jgi:uncharacterized membrane protein YfcA
MYHFVFRHFLRHRQLSFKNQAERSISMSWFILFPVIFTASFILTMVGLGGGLIFAPLFILLEFPVSTAVSASLFLNGIAALAAAITYFRKK